MLRRPPARSHLVVLAAIVLVALVAQVASAGPSGSAGAGGGKTLAKLKKQLKQQGARIAALEAEPGAGGEAGGDLTGFFPAPSVATGAITTAKLADGSVAGIDLAAEVRVVPIAFHASSVSEDPMNTITSVASTPGVELRAECSDQTPDHVVLDLYVRSPTGSGVRGIATRATAPGTAPTELVSTTSAPATDQLVLQADADLLTPAIEQVFATLQITSGSPELRTDLVTVDMRPDPIGCSLLGTLVPSA